MRTPEDLKAWAARKYAAGFRRWAAEATDDWRPLGFPVDPPIESEVAAHPSEGSKWVRGWAEFERFAPDGVRVEWAERTWRAFGAQRLPTRVTLASAAALAAVADQTPEWQELVDRVDMLRAAWGETPGLAQALPGVAAKLGRLPAADLPRLIAVVDWFAENPSSGLLVRQVPVEGVDTKWVERHRDLVMRLVKARTGEAGLGLRVEPRRFRVRVLGSPGLADFTASASELARLEYAPECVLLVENRDSTVPLADLPGVIAVHSQGLAAPELAVVPWIVRSRVLYWGDLDSHGLRILGLVRGALPQTESVLMDRPTFERFEALSGDEPAPYRGIVGHLTRGEQEALDLLRQGDRRLEQERIPWPHALHEIRVMLDLHR
jgi:hypothetical protein